MTFAAAVVTGNTAEWVSAVGGIFTVLIALFVWIGSYQGRLRTAVRSALIEFTTSEMALARDTVATLRRKRRLTGSEREELRRQTFVLLWALQRLGGVREVALRAIAPADVELLYRHVDAVVEELGPVIQRLGLCNFREAVDLANTALVALPDVMKWYGLRVRNTRPSKRLPTSAGSCRVRGTRS